MKLVPRPTTVSPVNSARAVGSKKATWSALCPGAVHGDELGPAGLEPLRRR